MKHLTYNPFNPLHRHLDMNILFTPLNISFMVLSIANEYTSKFFSSCQLCFWLALPYTPINLQALASSWNV
jgi:hypothetical protein